MLAHDCMSKVQLNDITKTLGKRCVVSGLQLEIESGQIIVVLGQSGCGKTTTLNLICGLLAPDNGSVWIEDQDMTGVAPRNRDIAMMFQGDALYPHLTIRQNLSLSLKNVGDFKLREQRIESASKLLYLDDFLDRKPASLSGGEQRKAAMAKAMVRQSSVRLLDEPLSALDAPVRHELQQNLLNWHRSTPGTTIQVTHDGDEAMRLADRIAVMDGGKFTQVATPRELYQRPNCKAAALALGYTPAPMQFFQGHVAANKVQVPDLQLVDFPPMDDDTKVEIGVRPRDWTQVQADGDRAAAGVYFVGKVVQQEFVDGETFVQVECNSKRITAKASANDENVTLFASLALTHVFDAQTGQRIED